jgi:hypothetical protein
MTLIVTPGAANANSYATLAEATDYIGALTFSENWPAEAADQEKVLRQAAMVMETLAYQGTRTGPEVTQALAFPRIELLDRDGWIIASDAIPVPVKRAQIQLALALASEDRTVDAGGLAPETLEVGSIDLGRLVQRTVPAYVLQLLAPYLENSGNTVSMVRG